VITQIELLPATPDEADSRAHCAASPGSAPPPLNEDQREVIGLLSECRQLTTAEAVVFFGRRLYGNAEKLIGTRFARMVKRGLIVRLKPGVSALPNSMLSDNISPSQPAPGDVARPMLRTWIERDRFRRAKLAFAAAEEARREGRVADYDALIDRWRRILRTGGV